MLTGVEWKSAIETGEQVSRVHAHIWLTMQHYSQIQLNSAMIARQVKNAYNSGSGAFSKPPRGESSMYISKQPYVHIKLLPQGDWATVMRNYVTKSFNSPSGYANVHS